MINDSFTIVVLGACNSGKSSLINTVMKKEVCFVSHDGQPMTLEPQCICSGTKAYIDTPGLPKSPSKISTLKFYDEQHPSMIWLVVNFQAAIENDEFDILDQVLNVPTIVILNKVDFCKTEDVENFDNMNYSTKHQKLADVHKRLINEKKAHQNIRHIVVMSLKDERHDEWSPIGVEQLHIFTNNYIKKDEINYAQSGEEFSLSIAIIGYSSSGKSSMINAVLSDSQAAKVGCDGQLTTKEWTCCNIGKLKLWDCPAINKRSEELQRDILAIDANVQIDMIWFVLNYNSTDIDDEHNIYETLKISRSIPVIVIINKVDNLHKIHNLSSGELIEFCQKKPSSVLSRREKLTQLRDRIYDTWPKSMNLKAVTVTSLMSDDDIEGENAKPIGVDVLLDITRKNLENDNKKSVLDVLKQPKKRHEINKNRNDERHHLPQSTNNILMAIRQFFLYLQMRFMEYLGHGEG